MTGRWAAAIEEILTPSLWVWREDKQDWDILRFKDHESAAFAVSLLPKGTAHINALVR